MSRRTETIEHLRDRLRETDGITATITRDGVDIAVDIVIVKVEASRIIGRQFEILTESDDAAFLIGTDDLPGDPVLGDLITAGGIEYRVAEQRDIEAHWRWHDRARIQRVVFAQEWQDA